MSDTAPGCLYVIAAPSGGGKTSLVNALLARESGIRLSVSYTTRKPRPGEHEGVHYHFVDPARFDALRGDGEFLEHAHVHGHWYATSATWLAGQVASGQDVLLEIDWQGARQVRAALPECVPIFVLPPSRKELERRLRGRGTDSEEVILRRLRDAASDMTHWDEFGHVVVNDDFDRALEELRAIVAGRGEGSRRGRAGLAELAATLTGTAAGER
jgi:guanylate kinase